MISVENYFDDIPITLDYKYNLPKKYNGTDVKEKLREIFNQKCCYCESKIEHVVESQIEHYRPQKKYKWLKNEWTNLLLACPICNRTKSDRFPVANKQIKNKDENRDFWKADSYVLKSEKPLILHPVIDNIKKHFSYNYSGKLISLNSEKAATRIRLDKVNLQDNSKVLNLSNFEILAHLNCPTLNG